MSETLPAQETFSGGGISAVEFARLCRVLNRAATRYDLLIPRFRSPPRNPDLVRSIERHRNGAVVVSIKIRQRPALAVVADMVDGVIRANGDKSVKALSQARDEMWGEASVWLSSRTEATVAGRQNAGKPAERPKSGRSAGETVLRPSLKAA